MPAPTGGETTPPSERLTQAMRSDVGKTLLRTAVWGLWWLLLVSGEVWAQTSVPDAPTIDTVTAGSSSLGLTLAVTWTAPTSDGGAAIEAYDVRFIKTAGDETDDANWIVGEKVWESGDGTLSTTLSGLTDSTEYDVQMRAVNENGAGAWSATATGTTSDHGDTTSGATSLPLDTPMGGVIDTGTDVDYFTFTLTQETGLLIWTGGDLDTVGELQNSSGTVIDSNDDAPFSGDPLYFFMWETLAAGTYRIKVSSYGETTGSYVLRTRTMVDTSSIADAQEIVFDSDGNGAASGLIDPGDDTDYFTFTLAETTEIVIRTTGLVRDTVGFLFDSEVEMIADNDDGYLKPNDLAFLIRTRLEAGTYYIGVYDFGRDDTGWYTVHVNQGDEPGDTLETAVSLDIERSIAEASRIDPSSDADYFRFDLTETTNIFLGAVSDTVDIDGELLDENGNAVSTTLYDTSLFGDDGLHILSLDDRLDAGTYYIKVSSDSGDTGSYTIRAFSYATALDRCADIDRPSTVSDPLYGCQWHLNNAGQLKGGTSDEDINVEVVWDDVTLGAGINVAVVDDGMDYEHEDLSANVNTARNHDYTGEGDNENDIFDPFEDHGTAVAGIIAARDNDRGVRGVAPRARLYGYNLAQDFTDANEADAMQRDLNTDVSNNSWGPGDGYGLDTAPGIWELAIEKGITEGADNKGIFYAWAAGNGALRGDNSNYDGYANHYGVTAACAVNDQGKRSEYSEEGANLWVCAPSSDSTRDRHGIATTDNDDSYRNNFGGTSAAAPIVSGVAALVRSANTALTWRDVKLILAASARQNDADNTGWEDGALQYGSDTETYHFNHEYGFGVVDAEAAVDLADDWTNLPTLEKETVESSETLNLDIPTSGTVSNSISLGSEVGFIEFVEINTNFDHGSFRDLQVELVSPSGTVSVLSVPYATPFGTYRLRQSFRFGSARHLGEDPAGTWTLRISDRIAGGSPGRLNSWSLTVYGHRSTPGAPYIDAVTPGPGSLSVVWKAPDNPGVSAVTGYEVRYLKASEDETDDANWTVEDTGWTSGDDLQYTLGSLESDVAYDVQVRAISDQGAGAWSETATETPSNNAPYFPAGTATTRSVNENASARTNVGAPVVATDPNDSALTYTLSGADAGAFAINASTGQLSVATGAALDHETTPSLAVVVTATDPSADADSIDVTITVEDVDESPTVTGQAGVEYAENGLLPVATYTASDPEGEAVTWLSLTGADSGSFIISNGVLSFNAAPDYEQPVDAGGNNVYEVTVRASDGTTSPATLDVTVTVTPVDEVHTLTELSRVASYPENDTGAVATYSVTDPERVAPMWSLAGADRDAFTLAGGVLSFANTPDYEAPADADRNNVYAVTVRATAGIHTVEENVTVRVTPVDEPPTLTGPSSVPPYAENTTTQVARYTATDPEGATVIWSVAGADDEDFTITNGILHFDPAPNYEAPADTDGDNDYAVTVVASDGNLTTTQSLTITVTDLDEAGSLTLSARQPQKATELIATWSDPDCAPNCVSAPTWVWERSANRSTWTEIENEDSASYTPVDEDLNTYLRVTATYNDGHGPNDKTLRRMADNPVRDEQNNAPPQFPLPPDEPGTRSVAENTAAGRNIGAPVVATDLDDDPLAYALDATSESVFAIDEHSGQLRTKAALDHETTPSYAVTVTATDLLGVAADITVTINVTDVDEPLTLTGPSTVPYEENDNQRVATFSADDPEGELITWALAGADRNDLTLSGGVLTFNTPPDYEADNRYSVTVEASAGSHTVRQPVTVNITNVNEAPAITRPADTDITYTENGTGPVATYRATDPERDSIQWTLEGTDADAFTLSGGVLRFRAPPDYEADDSYFVTVVASDGELTDRLFVTVTVTNEDEAGHLTLSSVQPQVDTELTAILDDPDGIVSTDWVWERSPDNRRTWESVKGTPAASYTPETDDVGAYLRVTVMYTDGTGTDQSAQLVSPHAVRLAPPTNDPPAFPASPPTRTVGTNAGAGSRVGAPVTAEDPGDPLTYTLKDEPATACFVIDWISGQLAVGPQGLLPCANAATRSPEQRTISARAEDSKTYEFTVRATDPSGESDETPVFITVSSSPPPPQPPVPGRGGGGGGGSGGGSGGGGGGGGGGSSRDLHGNTAAQATLVRLDSFAPWASATIGQINEADDIDYFELLVPQAGLLVVETTGSTDTMGTVWQAGAELVSAELVSADHGGVWQNFRLSTRVRAGAVVIAVAGSGRTGSYTLETRLVVGYLENPGLDSFQSGIGVLSGWVCAADAVTIELNGAPQEAAYGTARGDTETLCGDADNGFGLLFNWNLLGDGEHTVAAFVDDIELARTTVRVTTLGAEFLRDVAGSCEAADFPTVGEIVTLAWQEAQQNFVLAEGSRPAEENRFGTPGVGLLENPSPNSFQSGIGVISGWVCEAGEVLITLGDLAPQAAGYGTERQDTLDVCGDTDNGFGLLFNWNLLGDGEHEVLATVDGTELGRAVVWVTTLGEEFVRDAVGECVVDDFPNPGEEVRLVWQQATQNFVLAPLR